MIKAEIIDEHDTFVANDSMQKVQKVRLSDSITESMPSSLCIARCNPCMQPAAQLEEGSICNTTTKESEGLGVEWMLQSI